MPYASEKARQLYGRKWRAQHRSYMRDYGRTYYATFCQKERPKKYNKKNRPDGVLGAEIVHRNGDGG